MAACRKAAGGINVDEDLGGGSKAPFVLENRVDADADTGNGFAPVLSSCPLCGLQGPYGRLTARPSMGTSCSSVVTSTNASFPYSPYMAAYKPELGMAITGPVPATC